MEKANIRQKSTINSQAMLLRDDDDDAEKKNKSWEMFQPEGKGHHAPTAPRTSPHTLRTYLGEGFLCAVTSPLLLLRCRLWRAVVPWRGAGLFARAYGSVTTFDEI